MYSKRSEVASQFEYEKYVKLFRNLSRQLKPSLHKCRHAQIFLSHGVFFLILGHIELNLCDMII
ncbi:CLUMA_CG014827, isoform A [Clunio marinus]|uniref:CLUMA_CG014827, isoform A n=1 Tax=Clunio marinus TaxID=568069 RepID=A0A1J1IMK1_9DIPT|nr:CLUMA_CG014827, isoform A [Clunio marinus]